MSTLNWKDQVGITHSVNLKTPAELASMFSRYSTTKTLWLRDSSTTKGLSFFEHYINPAWTGEALDEGHKYSLKVYDGSKVLRLKNPDLKVNYLFSGQRSGYNYPDVVWLTFTKTWKAEDSIFADYDCNFYAETYKQSGPSNDIADLLIEVDGVRVASSVGVNNASWCLTLSGYHTVDVLIGVRGNNPDNKWWYNIISTES